jgi:large subunit ribosomal protein L2
MGKRIIQQARGHGSLTYRVRKRAYVYRIGYPITTGVGKVVDLINSPAHSAPLAKIELNGKVFYNPACTGMAVGDEIAFGEGEKAGNVLMLENIPTGTSVYNIENNPGDGGKMIRTAGSSAIVVKKGGGYAYILMPSKKEVRVDSRCRATIGVIAGHGRLDKPIIKAGKKWHMMKARNKLWPRTSALKMNAIDHPFGSGRGKRIKSKIAKRNAPPGARVGMIRPKRTGRRKR